VRSVELRIARIHYPIEVLGPGRRVWLQGCSLGCRGCMSKDTWDPDAGRSIAIDALLCTIIGARNSADLTGVTITGGEPFDQGAGLEAIVARIHEEWPEADILVYSGYSLTRLQTDHPEILSLIDAVMTGPYVERRETELIWRGSANQELTLLSDRVADLYQNAESSCLPRLQVGVDDDAVWIAGIPRRGDLDRIRQAAEIKGLVFGDVSWNL